MLKRQAAAPKRVRKKRRGGTSFTISSLDPTNDDKMLAEDIRVWEVSTSQRTGRVSASRRTIKHYHEAVNQPDQPSASKESGEHGESNADEAGILTDAENSPEMVKSHEKRRRTKVAKQNNSVSDIKRLGPYTLRANLRF